MKKIKRKTKEISSNKGITLIALIITIIVMLILVGVTVNVALNGGLFNKAKEAADSTNIEAEKEQLMMAALGAYDANSGVDFANMKLPEGFSGSKGIYTSSKTGKTYRINQKTAEVTEGEINYFEEIKQEAEGKSFTQMGAWNDNGTEIVFNNEEIRFDSIIDDFNLCVRVSFHGDYYDLMIISSDSWNEPIEQVKKVLLDNDDYFTVRIDINNDMEITGLTDDGKQQVATNKKIVIPSTITGTDGKSYPIKEIGKYAFRNNSDFETVEFEEGINLDSIRRQAFDGCTALNSITIPEGVITIEQHAFEECSSLSEATIPSTVDNMGGAVFEGCTTLQTIHVKGKTEAPVYHDKYSGSGWSVYWNSGTSAQVSWEG